MTEIYTHKTKADNNYGLSETIKTEINQLAIIPILSSSIYKDPLSAARELYANEVTSCKLSKLDTRIEIRLNQESRELVIQGFNSMGITREIFDKILKVMGNSGNNNGSNSGLFGLGFFSHVMLSEKMIIHSYSQDDQRFSFISKSGLSFEILPQEFAEKLEQYGTKLILTVKDEIDFIALIAKIKEIIEFSPIKTNFIIDEYDTNTQQFKSLKALMRNKEQVIRNKKYNSKSWKIYQNSTDIYDIVIIKEYPQNYGNKTFCYLVNMPIQLKLSFGYSYFNIYLHIKNEREIIPHVSRDFFNSESENKIKELIKNDIEIFDSMNNDELDLKDNDIMNYINDNDRFFKYRFHDISCKSIFNPKKTYFSRIFLEFIKRIPDNYNINGICIIKNSNQKAIQELYNLGYLCLISKDDDHGFKGLSNAQEILKEHNIKSKIGITPKKNYHIFTQARDPKYIFKVNNPKYTKFKFYTLGFVYEDSNKHLDPKIDIPKILKNKTFWTTKGYKKLNELDDFDICLTNEIYENYMNDYNKVFFTDRLSAELVALFYLKDIHEVNMITQFIQNYRFKNPEIEKLKNNRILNVYNISTLKELNEVLKFDS